MSPIAKL